MQALFKVGWSAVAVALHAASVSAHFEFHHRYSCGVCLDVLSAASAGDVTACERFQACSSFNSSTINCVDTCNTIEPLSRMKASESTPPDVRVSIAFGTKTYGTMRVSAITGSHDPAPIFEKNGAPSSWQYSEPFKYKWTDNALHTTQLENVTSDGVKLNINGVDLDVMIPSIGEGVAGVLIADPCFTDASITSFVGCSYGKKFQTVTRTPALLNAFVGNQGKHMNFWSILGDNFYDRTGAATKKFFSKLSMGTKSKPLITVPGNHDYWVLGAPEVGTVEDQYANGHMQFYAMDTKAAEAVMPSASGDDAVPFNFSVDPHKGHVLFGGNLPAIENAFFYNQIGNLGIAGFSGAYSLEATRGMMAEACRWFGERAQLGLLKLAVIVGHWDVAGLGASSQMAVPPFYDETKILPGCSDLDERGMLKFFMGHTHCNVPHPHGRNNTGFMVAGQGMEGCANYGIPIVDTTEGRVRVYHFEIDSSSGVDKFEPVVACLNSTVSWRNCTHLADVWLDQELK